MLVNSLKTVLARDFKVLPAFLGNLFATQFELKKIRENQKKVFIFFKKVCPLRLRDHLHRAALVNPQQVIVRQMHSMESILLGRMLELQKALLLKDIAYRVRQRLNPAILNKKDHYLDICLNHFVGSFYLKNLQIQARQIMFQKGFY